MNRPTLHARLLISTGIAMIIGSGPAIGLPAVGTVAQGSATISSTANQTTVTQTTPKAVINWLEFDTSSGQTVKFVDPNASSITLNRISGPATSFSGKLQSNGSVWLLNSQGIAFNGTAKVNTSGLLATTSTITDNDFMSGNYHFTPGSNGAATVSNAGSISVTKSGLAALVAPSVVNSGTIAAKISKITLASGDTYTVDLNGDGLINLAASNAMTAQNIVNTGTLDATGGSVIITAAQASSLLDNVINLDGIINANNLTASNQSGDLVYGATFSQSTGGDFRLNAYRNINTQNATIAPASGKLNVTLDSNDTGAAEGGSIYVAGITNINSNGGDIVLGGGATPLTGYAVGNNAPGIDSQGFAVYIDGIRLEYVNMNAGGGNVTLHGNALAHDTFTGASGIDTSSIGSLDIETSGTGSITLDGKGAYAGLNVDTYLSTEAGSIILTGIAKPNTDAVSGFGTGIISLGTIQSDSGNISISGKSLYTDTSYMYGPLTGTYLSSQVTSDSGNISITGTTGQSYYNIGLVINWAVTNNTGDIYLKGIAGNSYTQDGLPGYGLGIYLGYGSSITSTGVGPNAGNIFVYGIGGGGEGTQNQGILTSFGNIMSVDGNIGLKGVASSSGYLIFHDNVGIPGIEIADRTSIQSSGKGTISLTGVGAKAHDGAGIMIDSSIQPVENNILASGTGNIAFIADKLDITTLSARTGGTVTFAPLTPKTTIGVAGAAGRLAITTGILDSIDAANVQVGNTRDTGLMTVGAYGWNSNVSFLSGSGSIKLTGINSTDAGDSLVFSTLSGKFINQAGANALQPGVGGRYLIYVRDAQSDILGGLMPDFIQYGCTYGQPCTLPSGNGVLIAQSNRR